MFRKLFLFLCLFVTINGFSQKIDLLILNQDYHKALTAIDDKLNEKPSGELYYKQSMVYKQLMDYPSALNALDVALSLDSLNVNYLSGRADLYQSMGNNSAAVVDFKTALSIKPDDLLLKYNLGKAFLRINNYSKAFETFEEIHAVDSLNLMFNKYGALSAYKAHQYKRAIYLYKKYLDQNPNDLSAYFNISEAYEKTNNKTNSLQYLVIAQHKFPDNRALHLKLANTAFENKNFQIAQDSYDRYMTKYDTLVPVLLNYGICLYHNKHTEEAIEVLEDCYSMMPNDVYVNFYLGVSHKRLDHYELAAKYLDFAIYISIPEFHPEMYHHLAQVYGSQREFKKSIECYKKAYYLDSRKVEVLFEIATTYEEFNFNKTLALNYYQSYLKEAGEGAENAYYALDRIKKIKEELFFEE